MGLKIGAKYNCVEASTGKIQQAICRHAEKELARLQFIGASYWVELTPYSDVTRCNSKLTFNG